MLTIQKITAFLLAAISLFAFSACTDVVEIELDEADPILVVDAWLNNNNEDQVVRLTTTSPYFDSAATPSVNGAVVSILSSTGEEFDFVDEGDGNYRWSPLGGETLGSVGDFLALAIEYEGETYEAFSDIGRVPVIDSIAYELEEEDSFAEESLICNFYARDPQGQGDAYWIKTFKNGEFLNKPEEMNIAYDAGFNAGSATDGIIFIPPLRDLMNPIADDVDGQDKAPSPWEIGDEARVEIHSISDQAFFFMIVLQEQLLNSSNGIFAAPLSNSPGNVEATNEGVTDPLGIFTVSAISSLDYTLQ